ncbi:MAG: DUF4238 domain-containing protein [Promethearchaeota archaeon]
MKSHFHASATYLKHFSEDSSKGRKSKVHVFNKKLNKDQYLPVDKIGIKTGAFGKKIEEFHNLFEKKYDHFRDLISNRYPSNITTDRLKSGMELLFNYIFRTNETYDYLKESYRAYPELVRKYGEDPWHSSEVFPKLFFKLLLKRAYPVTIRGYPEDEFITGDNPIVIFRHPYKFVTVYLLPIDRRHIFCLGYYLKKEHLRCAEIYINQAEIITENVNVWIKFQADTHYII